MERESMDKEKVDLNWDMKKEEVSDILRSGGHRALFPFSLRIKSGALSGLNLLRR